MKILNNIVKKQYSFNGNSTLIMNISIKINNRNNHKKSFFNELFNTYLPLCINKLQNINLYHIHFKYYQ